MELKLYDFMLLSGDDYDTYDTVFDAEITVCLPYSEDEDDDYYNKCCVALAKLVTVKEYVKNVYYYDGVTCNWNELIKLNFDLFKEFEQKYWSCHYDDEDDFIYEWLHELEKFMAGYGTESIYKNFYESVLSKCKAV